MRPLLHTEVLNGRIMSPESESIANEHVPENANLDWPINRLLPNKYLDAIVKSERILA